MKNGRIYRTRCNGKQHGLAHFSRGLSRQRLYENETQSGQPRGKGAEWKSSVKALAQSSDVIITMVGYPKDVEEVYFGSEGIIENAKKVPTLSI